MEYYKSQKKRERCVLYEEFRSLRNEDIQKACGILCWRVEDLKSRGIPQFHKSYPPLLEFRKRQEKGFNWGLYVQDRLAVMVSLIPGYVPECWKGDLKERDFLWVTSLFSAKEFPGISHTFSPIKNQPPPSDS